MFDTENAGINYGDYFRGFKFISTIKFIAYLSGYSQITLNNFETPALPSVTPLCSNPNAIQSTTPSP